MEKFKSRKYALSVYVLLGSTIVPIAYHFIGISEAVTMSVLGILASVGVGYGIVNVQAAKTRTVKNEAPK